jgi:hypothetical protein
MIGAAAIFGAALALLAATGPALAAPPAPERALAVRRSGGHQSDSRY